MAQSKPQDPTIITAEDPRLAFIYQEALRGLTQQQAAIESLRNRAATLIFATSFVSSLLGGYGLRNGLQLWDWLGIVFLLTIGILCVALVWPYYNLRFRFDAKDLLDSYIDVEHPASLPQMHRLLALRIRDDWQRNGKIVKRLRELFQVALVCLILDILAWMFAAGIS